MQSSTGDPWADEGFGGEDDWEGKESVGSVEDDDEGEVDLEDDLEDDRDPKSEDDDAAGDDSDEE